MMFPISMAPGPHSSISEGFLHSIFSGLRGILGSWNLVNPLLRMNEAWMDECAARLQPLVDKYKDPDNTKIEKISRFYRNNPIMSWGQKKISFKKNFKYLNLCPYKINELILDFQSETFRFSVAVFCKN